MEAVMDKYRGNVGAIKALVRETEVHRDYFATPVGLQPVLMVRHSDDTVRVLHNRCPHKGTRITAEGCGNTGKFFRCPYHAWSFRTDGTLRQIPLARGYDKAKLDESHAGAGMNPVK